MDDSAREENRYRSFVVRCWREGGAEVGEPHWRFSLEEAGRPGARKGFDRVESCTAYLVEQLNENEASGNK